MTPAGAAGAAGAAVERAVRHSRRPRPKRRGGPSVDWCNNGGPTRDAAGRGAGGGGRAEQQPPAGWTPPTLEPNEGGLFRSDNKGQSWTLVSNCNARPMYFSQIRVDPTNDKTIYVAGLPRRRNRSTAARRSRRSTTAGGIGNRGTSISTRSGSIRRTRSTSCSATMAASTSAGIRARRGTTCNTMATALAYCGHGRHAASVLRLHRPAGQRQLGRPERDAQPHRDHRTPTGSAFGGGDGFQTAVDPTDFNIVYTESQDGARAATICAPARQSIRPSAAGGGGRGAPAAREQAATGRIAGGAALARRRAGRRRRPVQVAGGGGGGRGGHRTCQRAARRHVSLQLEHAVHALAAQSEHRLDGRQPPVQVVQPRRHLDGERRSHEADRSLQGHGDGRAGQRRRSSRRTTASSPTARSSRSPNRRSMPRRRLGRHRRRQSAGEPRRRRDVHGSRQEHPGLPGRAADDNPYWISRIDASHFDAGTAYVVGRRPSQRRSQAVRLRHARLRRRRSRASPATCRLRATCRSCAKIRRTGICSTPAPSSGCSSRSTRGKTWEKFMNNYPTVRTDDILDPSARRRSDRRDARPQHLDRRRHHAAAAADAGGRGGGRDAVRRSSGDRVPERPAERSAGRRAEGLRRRERAARHGDQLLPEERRRAAT